MADCQATTKTGKQCKGPAGPDGFCYSHTPSVSPDERRQTRAAGGKNSSAMLRVVASFPPHFQRVYTLLVTAMEAVADGTGEPQRLTALATGARAVVALVEVADLAARLEGMESSLKEMQQHDNERNT